jgi:ornithine decarboxylase
VLASKRSDVKFKTTLWGPTCDSTDKICEDIQLELLDIDDVLYFENMGAYTIPLNTRFNGFQSSKITYFINYDDW